MARISVAVLLVIFFGLAIGSKHLTCNTFDEPAHIINGVSFWATHEFRFPAESNLLQRWCALPIVFGGFQLPTWNEPEWKQWMYFGLGQRLLFRMGNDADAIVLCARVMIALLAVMLGYVVYRWSRRLFGVRGGLISLFAFVCCPTLLAHGALATTDVGMALMFLLSVTALWALLQRCTPWTLLGSCLATAALVVSKMSWVLLLPMALLLLAIRLASGRPLRVRFGTRRWQIQGRGPQLWVYSLLVLPHVAAAVAMIWLVFDLRFEAVPQPQAGEGRIDWEVIRESGTLGKIVGWTYDHRLLPEGYLFPLFTSLKGTQGRMSFLRGEIDAQGRVEFFPYCFLVKTPPATLLLLIAATLIGLSRWLGRPRHLWRALYRTAPLWVLFAGYWGACLTSGINIGQRHLLPVYPVVFIWLGAVGRWLPRRRRWSALAAVPVLLLAWLAGETLYRWPYYLAYFNVFAGGPSEGYRHLVDSSLDWGQELPRLRTWLEQHRVEGEPVYLSYFGTADIRYYEVPATILPGMFDPSRTPGIPWLPGTYCISASMLQGLYTDPVGAWSEQREQGYRSLLQAVQRVERKPSDAGQAAHHAQLLQQFDQLRLSRLCATLRRRRPDAQVGYAILIYRVSAAELEKGPFAE